MVPLLSVYHNIYMGQLERHTALSNLCNLLKPRRQAWQAIETLAGELGAERELRIQLPWLAEEARERAFAYERERAYACAGLPAPSTAPTRSGLPSTGRPRRGPS